MSKDSKILVLGGRGLVGSAICGALKKAGYSHVKAPTSAELDLTDQAKTKTYFEKEKPDCVFIAAAKVGGIVANDTYRADFIHQNLMIQNNVFDAAFKAKTEKLIFLGSSCIYPKLCPQPIKEEYLLTGLLEPTNEPYAIAKIAGLKTVQAYRQQYGMKWFSVMPTNLYGPNDNFDLQNSHVIPGMIHRMHLAKVAGDKVFQVWGTGKPRREFLYSEDLAEACVYLMENFEPKDGQDWINVGTGSDVTIAELAALIADVVGYKGDLAFDTTKPDGTPQKLLDVSMVNGLGWKARTGLKDGLGMAYEAFEKSAT